jgi:hypothetical protein
MSIKKVLQAEQEELREHIDNALKMFWLNNKKRTESFSTERKNSYDVLCFTNRNFEAFGVTCYDEKVYIARDVRLHDEKEFDPIYLQDVGNMDINLLIHFVGQIEEKFSN